MFHNAYDLTLEYADCIFKKFYFQVEFLNCGGYLSQCIKCNKSFGITSSLAQV